MEVNFFEYIESAHETVKNHKDFLNAELGFSDEPEGEEKNLAYPEGMLNIYNSSKGRLPQVSQYVLKYLFTVCREIWKR